MSSYRAAAPFPTVTLGPLPTLPRRIAVVPFALLVPIVVSWIGALVWHFVLPSTVPAEVRCRRDEASVTCEWWLEGKLQKTTRGGADQIQVTRTETKTRNGTYTSVCFSLAGEAVLCHDADEAAARVRALRPSEAIVLDDSRHMSNVFLFVAPAATLFLAPLGVLLLARMRARRRTVTVGVTPRTLILPSGQVDRVAREQVRAVFLERAVLPRQSIEYGDGERWHTIATWRSYPGELEGFAASLRAALQEFPRGV